MKSAFCKTHKRGCSSTKTRSDHPQPRDKKGRYKRQPKQRKLI